MPRKPAAAYAVPSPDGTPPRLQPPPSLSARERAVFDELVDAVDRKHFRLGDRPLLVGYSRAICFESYAAAALAKDPTDTKMMALWEKSSRSMVALSMRLRLSPQSRQTSRAASREKPRVGPMPWE